MARARAEAVMRLSPGLLVQLGLALAGLVVTFWSPSIVPPAGMLVTPEADLVLALLLAPILWPLAVYAGNASFWMVRRLQFGASYGHAVFTEAELAHIHLSEDRHLATFPTRRNM